MNTLLHQLHIVEIKASNHPFDDKDFDRLHRYLDAFDLFFETFPSVKKEFPSGYRITLVADEEKLIQGVNKRAYMSAVKEGKVLRIAWLDFLANAKKTHEEFLKTATGLSNLGLGTL